jgi:hypothetical protein
MDLDICKRALAACQHDPLRCRGAAAAALRLAVNCCFSAPPLASHPPPILGPLALHPVTVDPSGAYNASAGCSLLQLAWRGDLEGVKARLHLGADVNSGDGAALRCAAARGHADLAGFLVSLGGISQVRVHAPGRMRGLSCSIHAQFDQRAPRCGCMHAGNN